MPQKNLKIPNISCEHCVRTITNELTEIDGVASVSGSADKKEVTVDWDDPATLDQIQEKLKEINYPAE